MWHQPGLVIACDQVCANTHAAYEHAHMLDSTLSPVCVCRLTCSVSGESQGSSSVTSSDGWLSTTLPTSMLLPTAASCSGSHTVPWSDTWATILFGWSQACHSHCWRECSTVIRFSPGLGKGRSTFVSFPPPPPLHNTYKPLTFRTGGR